MALRIDRYDCLYWKVAESKLDFDHKRLEIRLQGYRDEAARRGGLHPSASMTLQRPIADEMLDRIAGDHLSLINAAYELLHAPYQVDAGDPESPIEANDWLGAADLQ